MTRSNVKTLVLVAAALAASAAFAQTATPATPATPPAATTMPAGKKDSGLEAMFAKMDANKDGKLSKEEADKAPALAGRFAELDKNADGFLSPDEFAAGLAK